MANDISKIKTPDGVVHDLKDSRVPANAKFTDTNYYHTTGSWNGLTYTATANGGAGALALTLPTGTTSTTVARGDHTHTPSSIGAVPLEYAIGKSGKDFVGWVTFAKCTLNSNSATTPQIIWIDIARQYSSPGPETYSLLLQVTYNTTSISAAQVNFTLLNGTIFNDQIIKKIRYSKDTTNRIGFLEFYVDPSFNVYENPTYIAIRQIIDGGYRWTPLSPYTLQTANVTTVAELDLTSGTKLNSLDVAGTINGSELITYLATPSPTDAWKALGGRSSGFKLAIGRWQSGAPAWTSGDYSSSLVFGGADTKGLLGLAYYSPTVTFGGGSVGSSTDDAPIWYFRLAATSGQTYAFPGTSKTLAASDGSNASGTWKIDVLPFNSGASGITSADSAWVTTTGQNKVYDNQSNKKWIWGARYTSSGWSNSDTGDMRFWLYGDSAGQWLNMNLDGYYFSLKGFIGDSSSATVGLSTAPMYAGYFTNLSANKITATELYGDSIKAALGDYNGVVTYNANTNALSAENPLRYDNTAGTVYKLTSNTLIAAPLGMVGAHDVLAFSRISTPTVEVYNGSSWVAGTYNPNIFAHLQYGASQDAVDTTNGVYGTRWTFTGLDFCGANMLVWGFSWQSTYVYVDILVESKAADATTWTNLLTVTGTDGNTSAGASPITGRCYTMVRITIQRNGTATGRARLKGLQLLSSRWGDQGAGIEFSYPYLYSAGNTATDSKYLAPITNNAWMLGVSNCQWGAVYAKTIYEDGASLASKYAGISHTHSYLPLSGGALTGDVTLATGKTIRPAAATNSCSLGTASYPWNYVHTKGISITDAGEVGLPFEGDGFLKYDQDSRLYLDNTAYATAAHKHGMTSANDMIIGGSGGTPTRLAKGNNNTFLGINSSGNIAWGTPGGTNAGHTHTLKITTVQGTNVTDLRSNTTYKLVVGNASYQFKTPTDYTCLAEGTKILMADNSEKNIEDVVAGDIIMSYDPNTEKLCEAVIIDNIPTGRSDDFVNYYFDDGSFLSIFGKHCIYSADEGTARGVDYWEPGWKTISADGKEVMYIGSENVHNAGRKRHFDLHSSNKLYFANGILNAQSLTLDYPMYKDEGLPEEFITALKADFDSSASLHTHQFDKKTGATLVPILKELKAQKKVMDDNKKRLADSDYLVAKFTEGLISAAEWLKAKAERAGWRSAVNKAEPLYAAAEERYNAFKAKYKAPNTKRERFNAAVARDNACLDALKAYYKSKNEVSK